MDQQVPDPARKFVVQNAREHQDNLVLFWAQDSEGYTPDIEKAHLFTKHEAFALAAEQSTNLPHHVDTIRKAQISVLDRDALSALQRKMSTTEAPKAAEQPASGTNSTEALRTKLTEVIQERDILKMSIHDAGSKTGLIKEDTKLNTHELTKLAENLGRRPVVLPGAALEAIRQRDMLGKAIFDAATHAGMCTPDAQLTGPQLMTLADDLGAAAAETVSRNVADINASAQNTPHKPVDTSDEGAFAVLLDHLDEKDWMNDEAEDPDSGPGMG